jgi:hypothetical protein
LFNNGERTAPVTFSQNEGVAGAGFFHVVGKPSVRGRRGDGVAAHAASETFFPDFLYVGGRPGL